MSLRPGDMLVDTRSGEARFRIAKLMDEGRSYFIAAGEDTHLEDMKVILKAIRYEDDAGARTVKERREVIDVELEALAVSSPLFPEPIDFLLVDDPEHGPEPVLVLEFIHGKTLRHEVERTKGKGLDPRRALAIIHELALGLHTLHEAGFAYRDLNPDHIIVGFDDNIHLVGTGNIARIGQRPQAAKIGVSKIWSAPEIRYERSGKFIQPQADVYSLGALLAFMLTAEEPTSLVEAPLNPKAFGRLKTLEPLGYGLLVARCIQSMAKRRFKNLAVMAEHLTPETLPSNSTRGFSKVTLPQPFTAHAEGDPDNRSTRSKLSQGPLISVESDEKPDKRRKRRKKPSEEALARREDKAVAKRTHWTQSCIPWVTFSAFLLVSGAAAIVQWWL